MEYLIRKFINELKKNVDVAYIDNSNLIIKYINETKVEFNFTIVIFSKFKNKLNDISIKEHLKKEIKEFFYKIYKSNVNIDLDLLLSNDLECNEVDERIKTYISITIDFYTKENSKLFVKDLVEYFFAYYLLISYDDKIFFEIKIYYKDLYIEISGEKMFYYLLLTKENTERILKLILSISDEVQLTIYKNNETDFEITIDYDNYVILYPIILNISKLLNNILIGKYKNTKHLLNDINKKFFKLKLFTILA